MKAILLALMNFSFLVSPAQSETSLVKKEKQKKNIHQHFGLYAGGGMSILRLGVNENAVADSGQVIPAVTARNSWNFNAGIFISAEAGAVVFRPAFGATLSPASLVYDFGHPVNETHEIFPVTFDAALHVSSKSLWRTKPRTPADTVATSWFTPVIGFRFGFPAEMFNALHPAMQPSRQCVEGGMAWRFEKKVRGNLHQRRSIELMFSFNINNLKAEADNIRTQVVSKLFKHSVALRFYFQ